MDKNAACHPTTYTKKSKITSWASQASPNWGNIHDDRIYFSWAMDIGAKL